MTILDIGQIIKTRRLELDLTLKEVGDAVGVSESTVSRWEDGNIANMKRNRIAALAKILKLNPNIIMGWEDGSDDENDSSYYLNPEAAKIAQDVYDNPELRILFDAAKNVSPDDIKAVADMMLRMRRKEQGDVD